MNVSAKRNKANILNHWNIIESLTLLEFWVDSKTVMVSQSSRVLVKRAIKLFLDDLRDRCICFAEVSEACFEFLMRAFFFFYFTLKTCKLMYNSRTRPEIKPVESKRLLIVFHTHQKFLNRV